MQSKRWAWTHRHAVPLFVASVVAVMLAGGGLVGVLVFDRSGDRPVDNGATPPPTPGGGQGSGPAGSSGQVDDCLLGQWEMISHTENLLSVGTLTLVGDGARFEYRDDGTGEADYGDGTLLRTSGLASIDAVVKGRLSFRYRAQDNIFQLLEVDSEATMTLDIIGPTEYRLDTEPINYTCIGDVATFEEASRGYRAEMHRR